jgi:hypothetical protein
MERVTISVSDDLYQRMERWRDQLDISRVCEKALDKEVRRLSRKSPRGRSAQRPPTGFDGRDTPFDL